MSKAEMAKLLEGILNDSEMAGRIAGRDFSDLGEGELTEAERALLSAAGTDLDDDVSGFAIDAFLKLGDIDGESEDATYAKIEMENVRFALDHLKMGVIAKL